MKKILVIGGVAGGASFAARMRRLDESAEIIMVDKGDYISFANCGLPYYIGDTIKDRGNLILQTPERFKARFNVDVRIRSEVISIDTAAKQATIKSPGGTYTESWDYLVISPGSTPVKPPMPGIDSPHVHTLKSLNDTDRIRSLVDKGGVSSAVVIGGGFIGLEMAEELVLRGVKVTQVELLDQVFAPADREMAVMLHDHLGMNGVVLQLGHGVKRISDTGAVVLDNGAEIQADLVIMAIGVRPDTDFLKTSGVSMTDRGAVIVDANMRTNVPDVYAVGDAVAVTDFVAGNQVVIPLAGPANRQGRIAADNIAGIPSTYKKTQGTAICKVFDLTAAVTGLNEKNAKRLKIPYVKSYTHSASHATYYPGATMLSMKILFAPGSGKLLGAQIIGRDGVDKRIDVLATALRHSLCVNDLADLELAYAPPYGSAKDPVNMAGFVAQNILSGISPVFYAEEVRSIDQSGQQLLDVRTIAEHERGSIPGAVNVPLDSLRQRLGALDKSKEQLVFCQVGLRGHLASRILLQNGFRARNLSGGYATWRTV